MQKNENQILMEEYGTRINLEDYSSFCKPLHLPEDMQNVYIYSKQKDKAVRERLICTPMEEEWKERIKDCFWYSKNHYNPQKYKTSNGPIKKEIFDLRDRLIKFAGEEACMDATEEDIDDILEYGQFWIGYGAKKMIGAPSQCHRNTCELWELNKDKMKICTGYALSDDGMWRQHSWGIVKTPGSIKIIETTKERVAYYGFIMTDEQARKFAYWNC